jgi:hypothetical protein
MQGAKWRTLHHRLFGALCCFPRFFIQYGREAIQARLLLMCGGEDRFKILNRRKLTHPYQHSRTTCCHEQKIVLRHSRLLNSVTSLSQHLGIVEGQM